MLLTTKFLLPALLLGGVQLIVVPTVIGAAEVQAVLVLYQAH
jgi:hypothetical protein